MKQQHWKIFVAHEHALERLSNQIERAVQQGQITDARGASLIRECVEHADRMEKLINKVERAMGHKR
jgi:hypothetical protein